MTSKSTPPAQSRDMKQPCKHPRVQIRSEEHTSELQSLRHLVCRLLLEKKKGSPDFPAAPNRPASELLGNSPVQKDSADCAAPSERRSGAPTPGNSKKDSCLFLKKRGPAELNFFPSHHLFPT